MQLAGINLSYCSSKGHSKSVQSYSDWSLLFYDETFHHWWECFLPGWQCPIHRAQRITKWFDEYENDVNYMLWPLQSPDPNQVEHRFWWTQIVTALLSTIIKTQTEVIPFGRIMFPPVQFQTLVESVPRHVEAVLAACGGPTLLTH